MRSTRPISGTLLHFFLSARGRFRKRSPRASALQIRERLRLCRNGLISELAGGVPFSQRNRAPRTNGFTAVSTHYAKRHAALLNLASRRRRRQLRERGTYTAKTTDDAATIRQLGGKSSFSRQPACAGVALKVQGAPGCTGGRFAREGSGGRGRGIFELPSAHIAN